MGKTSEGIVKSKYFVDTKITPPDSLERFIFMSSLYYCLKILANKKGLQLEKASVYETLNMNYKDFFTSLLYSK